MLMVPRAHQISNGGAMPSRIEDYAVIGNCETMALVGLNGSIDWLALPRFDSAACFSALLGEPGHGRWLIAPTADAVRVTRHYRGHTMILETIFETETGAACVIDFLTRREGVSDLVRIVRGLRGAVVMWTELIVRFEYGSVVPWVSRRDDGRRAITAGPDRLLFETSVPLRGENFENRREVRDIVRQRSHLYLELVAVLLPCASAVAGR